MYSLAYVGTLIEVFLFLYERIRKLFLCFLFKYGKKCGFWTLQHPLSIPPLPKTQFLQIQWREHLGILTGFFLSLYVTIRKFVFCFFLNMQKIGQLPHFRPPWGVNLIPTQNFCVAFHKVGCLNIIFIVKYYLDIEMIYRETNILKFEK